MSVSNIIEVTFGSSTLVFTSPYYKYNSGMYLLFSDLDLPESYQVHFANSVSETSLEMVGTSDGVLIPDDVWQTGATIYAWVYLHPTNDSAVTKYEVRIPVSGRADLPDGTEPTEAEQTTIDTLVTALNTAVEDAQTAQTAIENMAVSAESLAEGSTATVTKTESGGVVNLAFGIPIGATGASGQDGSDGVGIASTVLNADYTLTITLTDGTSYTTPSIRGASGADGTDGSDGNGIASVVLNADYTLTLTFTDGTSYTTTSIRGAQGVAGQDGYSPSATVTKVGDTATITITDKNGTTTAQISDGSGGGSATSPTASVAKVGDTATITITDINGTTTASISDGQNGTNGTNGQDGYSPTASVSKSGGTATITITDKNGTTTATVSDGANGQNGTNGTNGTDGTTFTPSVSNAGMISWTNDGGKQNPSAVDLVAAIPTATTQTAGKMSAADKGRLDTLYADYSSALTALGVI